MQGASLLQNGDVTTGGLDPNAVFIERIVRQAGVGSQQFTIIKTIQEHNPLNRQVANNQITINNARLKSQERQKQGKRFGL